MDWWIILQNETAPEGTTTTQDAAAPTPAEADASAAPRARRFLPRLAPGTLIAVAALVLLAWQWLETRERLLDMQQEVARRLGAGELQDKELRVLSTQTQDAAAALDGRIARLEAKLTEAQSQQAALEQMYQELSRSKDERLLAEIEQTVALAAQQLQIAGNVPAALIALQGADARLAQANQAQFLPLRRALAQDIEHLRALPLVDVSGIALKLEGVIGNVDALHMAYEQRPQPTAAIVPAASENVLWRSLLADLWREMRQLIRIERMDQPSPALLAPSNTFFLRENLKLRLLNARLALLQRDSRSFDLEVTQAKDWLARYFDARDPAVQSAQADLAALGGSALSIDLPSLETLTALRNAKSGARK